MIPKIIHYCWFGKGKKPKIFYKCIASWEKYCPNYKIIEWNEDNFNIENTPLYVRQAYEAKLYAFVSDYVRLYVLYNHGGVYMDTDVEVISSIDELLNNKAFSGFDNDSGYVQTGIIGSEKEIPIFQEFLEEYNKITFIKENGQYDYKTNVERITNTLCKYGLTLNNKFQIVKDISIFPKEYFCPTSWKFNLRIFQFTKNTKIVHHFASSWWKEKYSRKTKIKIFLTKIYIPLVVYYLKIKYHK